MHMVVISQGGKKIAEWILLEELAHTAHGKEWIFRDQYDVFSGDESWLIN